MGATIFFLSNWQQWTTVGSFGAQRSQRTLWYCRCHNTLEHWNFYFITLRSFCEKLGSTTTKFMFSYAHYFWCHHVYSAPTVEDQAVTKLHWLPVKWKIICKQGCNVEWVKRTLVRKRWRKWCCQRYTSRHLFANNTV